MRYIFLSTLTLTLLSLTQFLSAQSDTDIQFKKGDIEIAAGIGLMNTFVAKNTRAVMPPVSLTMGYRLKDNISIGTYMGYSKTNYVAPNEPAFDDPAPPELTNNYFQFGLRGQGHFLRNRMDFYGGAMIGYNFSINNYSNLPPDGRLENLIVEDYSDAVVFSGHIGIKYLLTEHFGVYGEIGYGASLINLGLTTRF